MKICSKCVLPETFPGIRFDENGVCSFCRESGRTEDLEHRKQEYRQRFEMLLSEYRGKNVYDAIMCYSGGKDSTYTLKLLRQRYDLNILGVTFDNGFVPERTYRNIRNVAESLGIDHIFFKPRFDLLKKIFVEAASRNIYPSKTLERASTICTSCMGLVKFSTLRLAVEKNIPFIAFGWSPGQAPIASSIMKNNPAMAKMMQAAILEPLSRIAGSELRPYFLEEQYFSNAYQFPYNVSPLAFFDYSEEHILKEIAPLGWEMPPAVDSNSSNCLLNSFANHVHKQLMNFHPYALEIAGLVRSGAMSRSEGLKKIDCPEDDGTVDQVKKRLGLIPA